MHALFVVVEVEFKATGASIRIDLDLEPDLSWVGDDGRLNQLGWLKIHLANVARREA